MCVILLLLSAWWQWLERLGGVGLILLGLADNSVIPLPGSMDALTIVLSAHQKNWWPYYSAMATIGAVVGGYATYALGRKGGKEALEKKISQKRAQKLYKGFAKGGFWSLFIPALIPPPFPYSPFLLAAGALEYPRRWFFTAVALGRGLRYFALGYLGSIYSQQIFGFFEEYYKPILWIVIALSVLGGLAAAIWTWKRKREHKPVIPGSKDEHAKVA